MKTVIVKTHDTSKTISEVVVITKDGQPNVIKASKNVNYEFFDESIARAPNHIVTKRVNKDLHVSFESEGKESDLIIEGFYDNDSQALIGISEDGSYYHYIPDTGQVYDYVTQLEAGAVEGQALGGDEMAAPWWIAAVAGFPWWLGLGLIPLAFIKDDDDPDPVVPPVITNPPVANDDTGRGSVGDSVTINVLANDTDPQDDIDPTTVQLIDPATNKPTDGSVVVAGEGEWSVNPVNGAVTFTPISTFTGDPTPIDYVVSDKTGKTSDPATITIDSQLNPFITIPDGVALEFNPQDAGNPTGEGDLTVFEGDGPKPGTFNVVAEAGVATITVDGQNIINASIEEPVTITTSKGVLYIIGFEAATGNVFYAYDPNVLDHETNAPIIDSFALVVTDLNGKTGINTLEIAITDSIPLATNDTNEVTEDGVATVIGDLNINDGYGADGEGVIAVTPVTDVATTYGKITINTDGTYSYTLDNTNVDVNKLDDSEALTDTYTYTITDGDGDTTTATLTITISGRTDGDPVIDIPDEGPVDPTPVDPTDPNSPVNEGNPTGAGDKTVYEGDGPVDGTFTVTTDPADPNTTVTEISVGGTVIPVVNGSIAETIITTAQGGTLVIESYDPASGEVAYTYDPIVQDHTTDAPVMDNIEVIVTDSNGNTSNDSLDIAITDGLPVAKADMRTVTEDDTGIVGNVMGNDTINVDAPVNVVAVGTGSTINESSTAGVGVNIVGSYGVLTIDALGNYTYTPNAAAQALNAGQIGTDVFSYVIKDNDGDTSATTVTMTVTGVSEGGPTVVVVDTNGQADGDNSVVENATLTGQTFTVTAPDGLVKVSIAGTEVTAAQMADLTTSPVTITTTEGVLTLTGYDAATGLVTYNYDPTGDSKNHSAGDNSVMDSISIVVTDTANVAAAGTLDILITDTVPVAKADMRTVTEDDTGIVGNVMGNDTINVDAPVNVVAVGTGSTINESSTAGVGVNIVGSYGVLTIDALGNYTYTPNAAAQALNAGQIGTDVFSYVIKDNDGDTSATTVTMTVTGVSEGGPTVVVVDTNGQADGDNSVVENATLTGQTFTVTAPDGLVKVSIAGTEVTAAQMADLTTSPVTITTTEGVLTLTGYDAATGLVTYNYDPTGDSKNHSAGDNSVMDSISIVVTDTANVAAAGTLDILITDTVPVAKADMRTVTEDDTGIVGNVMGNDTINVDAPVNVVAVGTGSTINESSTAGVGVNIVGSYGVLTIDALGNYTYTPNAAAQALNAGQIGTDVFSYVIKDNDGDTSATTVTMTVTGVSEGGPTVVVVDTNGQADGDNSVVENATLTGQTFTVTAPDGLVKVSIAGTEVTAAQMADLTTSPVTITTTEGVLTLTGYDAATGLVTYNYDPTGDSKNHSAGDNSVMDSISIVVTDTANVAAAGTLDILITDTVPVAKADMRTVTEDDTGIVGNVMGNDTINVDAPVNVVAVGTGSTINESSTAGVGVNIVGSYGVLTIDALGNYTYTPNAAAQALNAGQIGTDVFSYVIKDNDGDTSATTVTMTVTGVSEGGPTVVVVDTNGQADGDNSVVENATLTGQTFTVTAPDGLVKVSIAGTEVTAAQMADLTTSPVTITTTEGVLTLTGYDAATGLVTYNYDPTGDSKNHSAGDNSVMDSISIVVTDTANVAAAGTLDILITDTVPVAKADMRTVTEDDTGIVGNVMGNDTINVDAPVNVVAVGTGSTINESSTAGVGVNIVGSYGVLTIDALGNYTYTPNAAAQALNAGQIGTDVFSYVIKDNDGDTSATTVTMTVTGVSEGGPTVVVVDTNGQADGDNSVVENATLTGQTFTVTAPDGLVKVSIAGTEVTAAQMADLTTSPVTITTTEGVLTLTGYDAATGLVTYNYDPTGDSKNHSAGDNSVMDSISIVVTDTANVAAAGTLDILITDTVPVAKADMRTVTEDDTGIVGNVMGNDTINVDAPVNVVAVGTGSTINESSTAGVGVNIVGSYGVLTIDALGNYTYTPNAAAQALNAGQIGTDVFSYVIKDNDGDTSATTVTMTVTGVSEGGPTVVVVDTNGQADGDNSVVENATLTGQTFTVTAPDGLVKVSIAGTEVTAAQMADLTTSPVTITTTEGVLTLTGYDAATGLVTYNYDPTGDSKNHSAGDNSVMDSISIVVTDTANVAAAGTLDILITDTVPVAKADMRTVTEDDTGIVGNVMGNDTINVDAPVNVVAVGTGSTINESSTAGVGVNIVGSYGVLTIDALGNYTYTPNAAAQALNAGQIGTDVFSYVIKDNDGDTSATTVTMTVTGANDAPVVKAISPVVVSEEGLVKGIKDTNGNSDTTDSITATGIIKFTDVDSSAFTIQLSGPTGITVQGKPVTWTWDNSTDTLTCSGIIN
ncbi:VCBS domain-containing protein [Psychrobacter sp. DAB_AL43B]|uniref:VCBS domain-containing protein n=1 Tax=Psychrobacter sp. DAB_AL43B TaxID=1028416 RepID=UPI0009A80D71|nr:VCBS domain-containing protein [Psychrobacter sp. DAB_AL43B]SLJ84794.1 VCBS repeat-containing protein [Psychrobacter sp. DAB_AL43B]